MYVISTYFDEIMASNESLSSDMSVAVPGFDLGGVSTGGEGLGNQ